MEVAVLPAETGGGGWGDGIVFGGEGGRDLNEGWWLGGGHTGRMSCMVETKLWVGARSDAELKPLCGKAVQTIISSWSHLQIHLVRVVEMEKIREKKAKKHLWDM